MTVAYWVLNYFCPFTKAVIGVVLSRRFVQLLSDLTQNVLTDGNQRPDIVSEGLRAVLFYWDHFLKCLESTKQKLR